MRSYGSSVREAIRLDGCEYVTSDAPFLRDASGRLDTDLLRSLFDAAHILENRGNVLRKGGRGQTLLFDVTDADGVAHRLCYRKYLRGGLAGKVMKDGFCRFAKSSNRAFAEFALLQEMLRLDLPVPAPIAARRSFTLTRIRNEIVLSCIPGTQNLAELLSQGEASAHRMRLVGATLRRFFDAGIAHTDLNIRNILIDDADRVFVIDFDKCRREESLSPRQCEAMLLRLGRSFEKERRLTSLNFEPDALMREIRSALRPL